MGRVHDEHGGVGGAVPASAPDGSRSISLFVFNTDVHLHAYAGDGEDGADPDVVARLDRALVACRDRCVFFEHAFSRTRPESDISRAHALAPQPVPVSPETADLVRRALGYCERSRGLFDITMGTVTSLWDFHESVVPSRLALSRALPHVGFERVVVEEGEGGAALSILDECTILDLGGVAKGYIADDLSDLMRASGVGRFVVNLGGNVLVRGGRPEGPRNRAGAPWRVGVVNPRDPAHHRAIVDIVEGSVVTSGIHERCFHKGGVAYHHILDPRTGMPAESDVASATIIAPRSMDCDGFSTTAFMLGARDAIDFIEELEGIEAVVIDRADEVRWTSGIGESLSLIPTLPRF
ncbi:MAG: FAD:protein FMN transferase [Collinsella sp.]|nr:FAD:protein FMN transferase [Collinsella sp.]